MDVTGYLYERAGSPIPTPAKAYDMLRDAEISLEYQTSLWLNSYPLWRNGIAQVRMPLL